MENTVKDLITPEEISDLLKLNKKNFRFAILYLMKAIKLDKINTLYKNNSDAAKANFVDALLSKLNIKYEVNEKDIENIPESGSLITISNHPYGGLDGLILLSILQKRRADFKIVANQFLNKIPELCDNFISVDPFRKNANTEVNLSGIKKIINHLDSKGVIGLFPAGEVSAFKTDSMKIEDCKWSKSAGKIIYKSNTPVIPVYFYGNNGILFNFLGMIHPSLRTLRLPSELLNKKDCIVKVRIGKIIHPEKLKEFDDANQMMRYLRAKTYSLGSSLDTSIGLNNFYIKNKEIKQEIIEPVEHSSIKSDLKLIKAQDLLFSASNYDVYISEPDSIPNILKEIGRLREITFRENGEGTNKSVDLDEFDLYYRHLFVWDRDSEKIAGSYRIGIGKEIYKKYKRKGFYLSQLFKMKKDFRDVLKCSLELGRSFVAKDYQKKHSVLFLLWKGVLAFLKMDSNKDVKFLIGPVSISNDYSTFSKEILIGFIKRYHFHEDYAKLIRPRKKFRPDVNEENAEILLDAEGKDFKLIDKLISEIELSNNKTPILLKKYLSQNAKIIGFNVDPKFNNSLDGFLIMNLANLPEETIPMLEK